MSAFFHALSVFRDMRPQAHIPRGWSQCEIRLRTLLWGDPLHHTRPASAPAFLSILRGGLSMEARLATVEEIEAVCAHYGLGAVGLFGLDDGTGLDFLPVEILGMDLEARGDPGRVHTAEGAA